MRPLTLLRRFQYVGILAGFVLSGTINGPLRAETLSTKATASIQIISPLSASVEQTLSFGRLQVKKGARVIYATIDPKLSKRPLTTVGLVRLPGGTPGALVATIKGEPNRNYRISLPASVLSLPGQYKISAFTMVSETRNQISINGNGLLNGSGIEVIRIGGTLMLTANAPMAIYTARVPITVLYE